jgi:thiamine biosynthesis lipoprotein
MSHDISRRRFIGISAAAAGLSLLPFGHSAKAQGHLVTWRGTALGAAATLQIHHPDRAAAERLIARSLQEVHRLERLLSLYLADSALVALNRRGVLEAPPAELVEVLGECLTHAVRTHGAFDPTVQPLWNLYADHFSRPDAAPEGPRPSAIEAAVEAVGWQKILVGRDRIAFTRRGMALTLNGIAQGYITDRVVALLRAAGVEHSLVDMGEGRAIGERPDGSRWQAGIADPDEPEKIAADLPIIDQAVATSAGYGFRFDPAGRFNHLFDPKTGLCANRYRSVTVVLPTATAADALSTAFTVMPVERIRDTLGHLGVGHVHLCTPERRWVRLEA